MTDSNRVIDGLRKAAEELAMYAPMKVNGRCQVYFDIAIHMIKEQEDNIKHLAHNLAVTQNNLNYYMNSND